MADIPASKRRGKVLVAPSQVNRKTAAPAPLCDRDDPDFKAAYDFLWDRKCTVFPDRLVGRFQAMEKRRSQEVILGKVRELAKAGRHNDIVCALMMSLYTAFMA